MTYTAGVLQHITTVEATALPAWRDRTRHTEIGPEKICTRCLEWWPADTEFFHRNPEGRTGLMSVCKVCHQASQTHRRAARQKQEPLL